MLKRFTALLLSLLLVLGGTGYALDDSDSGSGESIPFSPESISMSAALSITEGSSKKLTAETSEHVGMPEDEVTWSTSDTSVCTVSGTTSYDRATQRTTSTATLKATGLGKCTVTASFGTVKTTCTVYVMETPTVSLDKTALGSATIIWNQIAYAQGYRVYRSTDGGDWKRIATVSGGDTLTATDTTLSPAGTHRYTVRAYRTVGDTVLLSGYDPDGVIVSCQLPAPELVSAADTGSASIRVTWECSDNAAGYRVYRKTGSSGWKRLATLSGGSTASYTDSSAAFGTKYTYTVRSYCKTNGETVLSKYDSKGVSASCALPRPKTLSAAKSGSAIKVSWSKVSAASHYRVYRKTSASGSWKRIATVTGTSYTDKNVTSGKSYIYTVRAAVKQDGEWVLSSYLKDGVTCKAK